MQISAKESKDVSWKGQSFPLLCTHDILSTYSYAPPYLMSQPVQHYSLNEQGHRLWLNPDSLGVKIALISSSKVVLI